MSDESLPSTRRKFLATSAAASASALVMLSNGGCAHSGGKEIGTGGSGPEMLSAEPGANPNPAVDHGTSVRPFRIEVPEPVLTDLRRRIQATRWPDRETVEDRSQGAQLEKIRALVGFWGAQYDWRKAEAKLNALPQFLTTLDGLDIHFIHVQSRHPNALPLIMTHGWPGSVLELVKTIGPLTDPTAHGGRAEDAFHLVLPSMPGYGFSAWVTNTQTSSARLYWENDANNFNAVEIAIPAAITVFPGEIYQAPRSWVERSYRNLIHYSRVERGGHFAAWEEPQLFASELRTAFRTLRSTNGESK